MIRVDDPFIGFLSEHAFGLQKRVYTPDLYQVFCDTVWDYYHQHKRAFVWRETTNPYHIVVSEIMLQQTQTLRVVEKYLNFLTHFPTLQALAQSTRQEVLAQWVGLGYNRRALALHEIAQKVVHEYAGVLPDDPLVLQTFKGLGPATSASIVAFAFNKPTTFIETNIRSVYLHVFFNGQVGITDKELLPLIEQTRDLVNPREWYYALMDCGVMLKKLYPNPSKASRHYARQSTFVGSDRQVRGAIIRYLAQNTILEKNKLSQLFPKKQQRLPAIIEGLVKEGFIVDSGDKLQSA